MQRCKRSFWKNKKVIKLFQMLLEKSAVQSIDWKLFRKLDKKGIFDNFDTVYLAVRKTYVERLKKGLCMKCGERPFIKGKTRCAECVKKEKEYYKSYKG